MRKLSLIVHGLILISLIWVQGGTVANAQENTDDLKQAIMQNYADIVLAEYQDAYAGAEEMQTAIATFVADPSEETLILAREAWLAARETYGQTEAFRFYGGPIDDEDGPEGLLNAWPIDEAYIDYVEGAPDAGIINNSEDYPEITAELLESLNEVGAEENISVGYHAIEFLLWGQDQNEDGPGDRAYTDYTTAPNAERRGQYLLILPDLLIEHLAHLVEEWDSEADENYRAEFLALEPDVAIGYMLTGIGVLSKAELSGERIFTAYDNQDQEDEHSCFSDNTHRDIILNTQGIINVYTGSYTRTDGTVISGSSLADLMATVDPDLNETILAQLESVAEMTNAIHVPFDQAIVLAEHRPHIVETVFGLQDLGDMFAEVGIVLGITIDTALPE